MFLEPDIVFYLDCDEKIAFQRKSDIPSIVCLSERRKLFLTACETLKWVKIDSALSVENISQKVKYTIENRLNIRL